MLKKNLLLVLMCVTLHAGYSQELQARFTIISSKISSKVNKSVFQTLQTAVNNLINGRKWGKDAFQANEKIQCNFLLNIDQELGNNIYGAKMTIQAARPVYNSTYDSPLVNFMDDNVIFRYQEFQPVEFNENRIQGNDPLAANLTAVIAYYINIILGFDYDSYGLKGGEPYFQKAWNIVNNAPEAKEITGWKGFDSQRNRYWLSENLNNNRFSLMHEAIYSYYRSGLDLFYENEDEGRNGMVNALNFLNTIGTDNPSSMLLQFFFQGKSSEMVKIFSKAPTDLKTRVRDILTKIDAANSIVYKELR